MGVGVQRRADAGRVVDLEERHLVALDQRLDEHVAAVHRLALDGVDGHRRDIGIPRRDHLSLLGGLRGPLP